MNIILTCGHPFSGATTVHNVLVSGGLRPARPSRRDGLSVTSLQLRVLRAFAVDPAASKPIVQLHPGKVWQDLAVDLFLGNLDLGNWGWSDPQSIWLMEFWKDFDPQLRFVLVYRSFGKVIAEMARSGRVSAPEFEAAAGSLLACQRELLRFYHHHRNRCILVDADRVLGDPATFLGLANTAFGLALDTEPETLSEPASRIAANLQALLARSIPDGGVDLIALHSELEAVAELGMDVAQDLDLPDPLQAVAELQELVREFEQIAATRQKSEAALKRAERAEAESGRLSAVNSRLQSDYDSLLGQLHQIQEKFEQTSQQSQPAIANEASRKAEAAERAAELRAAHQARTAAERALAEQKKHAETASRDKAAAERTLAEQKKRAETASRDKAAAERTLAELRTKSSEQDKENQLLLLQLHQVQEELQDHYLATQNIDASAAKRSAMLMPRLWDAVRPVEFLLDLRREIVGENWYHAEQDGRWAGPEALSSLDLPILPPGRYEVRLDIVDAMTPEILAGLTLTLNGTRLDPGTIGTRLPVLVTAFYEAGDLPPEQPWRLDLAFPAVVSPATCGSDDQRHLAVRLRSVRVIALDLLTPATPPAGAPGKRKKRWWKRH